MQLINKAQPFSSRKFIFFHPLPTHLTGPTEVTEDKADVRIRGSLVARGTALEMIQERAQNYGDGYVCFIY